MRHTFERRESRKPVFGWILCLAVVCLLVCIACAWYFLQDTYALSLQMTGETEITLEVGQDFADPGAEAWIKDTREKKQPVSIAVIRDGQVDTAVLGTYQITYTANYKDQTDSETRTVHVVDTKAPEITLLGDAEVTILPIETYQEAGFTASDNYDGDITSRVQREEKDGMIVYTVQDSSGNQVSVTRKVNKHDPVAPVLELKGGSRVSIAIGTSFAEPGFTATDNCDGDLTSAVQVSGGIDPYRPGVYKLTYTVSDSFQNKTELTREVCVLPLSQSDIGEPNGKVIYLTFDDGPGAYTNELLDILAKYNVKVTFFVVNTQCISTIERAAREGHTIAIHTASHKFSQVYASEEAYFEDLYKMQEIIERHTGIKSMLLRFPGGSSNTISKDYNTGIMTRLAAAVQEKGFTYFDWNVDSNDAGGASSADEVFNNVIRGIGNKQASVVLQHDIKRCSIDAIERIIIWGLKNGYTFLTLDENSPTCHHGINN